MRLSIVFKILFPESKIAVCNVELQQRPPVTVEDLLSWEQVSKKSSLIYFHLIYYLYILFKLYLLYFISRNYMTKKLHHRIYKI